MSLEAINYGSVANDGTGDILREAFRKISANFAKFAVANGFATLDANGVLSPNQIPNIILSVPYVVASEAAMLALPAQPGGLAVRTDVNKTFILTAADPTVLANWTELLFNAPVTTVAGRTGAITLVAGDISDATANGRSLIAAADYAAMKVLLAVTASDVSGLGALALLSAITAAQISDATANGRSLITAANYAAIKALLAIAASDVSGLGNAAALTAGTSANNVLKLDSSGKAPSIVTKFVSTDQAITAGGLITVAHGQSAKPDLVRLEFVCVTANLGWSVGDVVDATNLGANNVVTGFAIYSDATNINLQAGTAGILIFTKSTGVWAGNPTLTNWKVRITAIFF